MRTLNILQYDHPLEVSGKCLLRKATRAIIYSRRKLLMVYSTVNQDYKFPGGGVKKGETLIDALKREVREECGYSAIQVDKPFGKIIELRQPKERAYDVFKMVSYYFLCQIPASAVLLSTNLDKYEMDLGFTPIWIELDEAISQNQMVLKRDPEQIPRWTVRDTFILELLKDIAV